MTLVLYESPRRLFRTLEDILQFWGDRDIAVARELTKRHEEVFRGKVSEALAHFAEGTKGELTLVAAGRDEQPLTNETSTEWREELRRFMDESHLKVKEAAEAIVARHGISRRLVYQEALKMKR